MVARDNIYGPGLANGSNGADAEKHFTLIIDHTSVW